jgi:diacylglycerol O-acyltransferase / wax synthase
MQPPIKHLSGLDATFLYLETPQTPMHVGSLQLYELPPGFKGSFHAQVIKHLTSRIHLSSIFTSKLAFMPLDLGHPIWVNDDDFDLGRHVRKITTPKMTVKMAEAMSAKLHGQLIDRNHPLWEFYIFDKITRKDGSICAGFYSKIHHAALDGKGGTVLANLKIGEMIGAVFSNSLAQYVKLAKSLPGAAAQIGNTLGKNNIKRSGKQIKASSPLSLAPKTPFNVGVSADRVFVTASIPFAECKMMAKSIDASFNDIVLWICSTALRSYLGKHASIPKKPLIAAMPVSLRDDSNKDMGNQASMSLANLGTHLAHPAKRMAAIMESTRKVKEALVDLKSVLPTDYPSFLAPWIVGGAARLALKTYGRGNIAQQLPMVANLVISNVPGPQVPLYMAGARMLTFHPLSIVMHGLGLNITVQTYAGSVDFGIIAGKNALPHAADLAKALVGAFEEARSLYTAGQTQNPLKAPKTVPAPVKTRVSKATKKQASTSKASTTKASTLNEPHVTVRRKTATPLSASSK